MSLQAASCLPSLLFSETDSREVLGRRSGARRDRRRLLSDELACEGKAIGGLRLLATLTGQGVRQHFGTESETLTEFGLQRFRRRKSDSHPAPAPETEPALPAP